MQDFEFKRTGQDGDRILYELYVDGVLVGKDLTLSGVIDLIHDNYEQEEIK